MIDDKSKTTVTWRNLEEGCRIMINKNKLNRGLYQALKTYFDTWRNFSSILLQTLKTYFERNNNE